MFNWNRQTIAFLELFHRFFDDDRRLSQTEKNYLLKQIRALPFADMEPRTLNFLSEIKSASLTEIRIKSMSFDDQLALVSLVVAAMQADQYAAKSEKHHLTDLLIDAGFDRYDLEELMPKIDKSRNSLDVLKTQTDSERFTSFLIALHVISSDHKICEKETAFVTKTFKETGVKGLDHDEAFTNLCLILELYKSSEPFKCVGLDTLSLLVNTLLDQVEKPAEDLYRAILTTELHLHYIGSAPVRSNSFSSLLDQIQLKQDEKHWLQLRLEDLTEEHTETYRLLLFGVDLIFDHRYLAEKDGLLDFLQDLRQHLKSVQKDRKQKEKVVSAIMTSVTDLSISALERQIILKLARELGITVDELRDIVSEVEQRTEGFILGLTQLIDEAKCQLRQVA